VPLATEIPYEIAPELKLALQELEGKFIKMQPSPAMSVAGQLEPQAITGFERGRDARVLQRWQTAIRMVWNYWSGHFDRSCRLGAFGQTKNKYASGGCCQAGYKRTFDDVV